MLRRKSEERDNSGHSLECAGIADCRGIVGRVDGDTECARFRWFSRPGFTVTRGFLVADHAPEIGLDTPTESQSGGGDVDAEHNAARQNCTCADTQPTSRLDAQPDTGRHRATDVRTTGSRCPGWKSDRARPRAQPQ